MLMSHLISGESRVELASVQQLKCCGNTSKYSHRVALSSVFESRGGLQHTRWTLSRSGSRPICRPQNFISSLAPVASLKSIRGSIKGLAAHLKQQMVHFFFFFFLRPPTSTKCSDLAKIEERGIRMCGSTERHQGLLVQRKNVLI